MPDEVRLIDYFYVTVADRPGEGARILATLQRAGINLLGFSGFPEGRNKGQLDLIPEDAAALVKVAAAANIPLSRRKRAFLIQGTDRPGVIAEIANTLAGLNINVTSAQVLCSGSGRYAGIVWVKQADVLRAAKLLTGRADIGPTEDEKVDLASDESFPASDAPPWTP